MKNEHGLTPQQETFATSLALGAAGTRAYREAFPHGRGSDKTICEKASRLAAVPAVRDRVQALMRKSAIAHENLVETVKKDWGDISLADAREISGIHRVCCRYCWGKCFRYQRTAGEREREYEAWLALPPKKRIGPFDEKGGIGYHAKRDPNPKCPECFGDGQMEVYFNDTRKLSPQGVKLYAGVKQTKDGLEVKLRSQDGALENLARVAGAYEKDNRQKMDPLVALLSELSGNVFEPRPDGGEPDGYADDEA